jgi:hypothetical protein
MKREKEIRKLEKKKEKKKRLQESRSTRAPEG